MTKPYQYRPLSGPRCIRVLELEPAADKSAPLEGKLIELDLAAQPHPRYTYEALSYVWGYPKGDQPIVCDGQEILVTENCHAAMRHLRHRLKRRRLWIDAVCIDQTNVLECNHQVAFMDNVYQNAKSVRIWLGSPESTSGIMRYKFLLRIARAGFKLQDWSPIEEIFSQTIGFLNDILLVDDKPFRYEIGHSSWVKRIWTVQECSFATVATVHYGSISCSWDDLYRALETGYTLAYNVLRVSNEDLKLLYHFRGLARHVVKMRKRSNRVSNGQQRPGSGDSKSNSTLVQDEPSRAIYAILKALRFTEAADPKDKAFGIYGLLRTLDVELPLPDYTKSVAEIYGETFVALHKARGDINFRHFWDPENNTHGLPSWAPDWTKPDDLEFRRKGMGRFKASRGSLVLDLNTKHPNQLRIKGVIIDTVTTVGPSYPIHDKKFVGAEAQAVFNSWIELFKTTAKPNGSTNQKAHSFKVLAEVLFGLSSYYWAPKTGYQLDVLEKWFNDKDRKVGIPGCFRDSEDGAIYEMYPFEFRDDIMVNWRNQRLFKSESDRLGMGWIHTAPGDLIILAAGCDVPLVIRPCGEFYNYIGPTYFHGAMHGAMWPSDSPEKLQDMILV